MRTDATQESTIRVVPFSAEECPKAPTSGPPLFTWQEYYGFRNVLLKVLRPHGTVGPMGELPILEDWESSEEAWEAGSRHPDFFVVSDMWNRWSRWNRVEASPWLIKAKLLSELVLMLEAFPDWCVYLALKKGGLTVFSNRVLYEGEIFAGSQSMDDLETRCQSTRPM